MSFILGNGRVNWDTAERRSDRYGSIRLYASDDSNVVLDPGSFLEQFGQLKAVVLEVRRSQHIGDFVRGLSPSTPDIGECITLGEGYLFTFDDNRAIGVMPRDDRNEDWMYPQALYRIHDQTVQLEFDQLLP